MEKYEKETAEVSSVSWVCYCMVKLSDVTDMPLK